MSLQFSGSEHDRLVSLRRKIDKYKIARDREECEASLYKFLQGAWKYIAPNSFVPGWHLEAIAEHLEAVRSGEIRRLIINVPPRTSKSSLLSVAFPAWVWANPENGPTSGPSTQFLFASYAQSLSVRDSRKCRQLIMSPWYQERWGHRFVMSGDQNSKIRFENDRQGYRLSTSVDGALTGEGGSIIGIDDPHNTQQSESAAIVESTLNWWDNAMSTRLNDPKTGAFIVTMQRQAENDLTGHILSSIDAGNWEHLMLPMRFEEDRKCVTSIGWEDPRIERGDLLCENRFGEKEVKLLESALGPFGTAGQLQQRPEPRGGGIIKREFWRIWDREAQADNDIRLGAYPSFDYIIASFDGAFGQKLENDFSALTVWGTWVETDASQRALELFGTPSVMIIAAWRKKLPLHGKSDSIRLYGETEKEYAERLKEQWGLVEWIADTCRKFHVDKLIVEAKANGHDVANEMQRLYGREDWMVVLDDPGPYDKVARTISMQHYFADGRVWRPDTEWADMVETEMAQFPKGAHDDLHDSSIAGLRHLKRMGLLVRRDENSAAVEALQYPLAPPRKLGYES